MNLDQQLTEQELANNAAGLPFDGIFRFTNPTEEDFIAKWNSVEYTFPAMKTSPMIIPGETPEGVQSIRKKFARDLAEREFFRSAKGVFMNSKDAGPKPALYTDSDLQPFAEKCLVALAPAAAKVEVVKEDKESVFSTDEDGKPRTVPLKAKDSLVKDGNVVA